MCIYNPNSAKINQWPILAKFTCALAGTPPFHSSQEILTKTDESAHNAFCKPCTSPNAVLVRCDRCERDVEFGVYEKHQQQHSVLMRQVEEEKALHGLIPCDICKLDIAFNQYKKHVSAHNSSSAQTTVPQHPILARTQSDPQMNKSLLPPSPFLQPTSVKPFQVSGIFACNLVESKETDKVRCEECLQECGIEEIYEHVKTHHSEVLNFHPKGSSSCYLVVEDQDCILCSVCNMRVHFNDIETHIETHNYDSVGDSFFYIAPKAEEELTRVLYNGKGGEKECKCCCIEYVEKDPLIYLLCGHYYHEECILAWIRKKKGEGVSPICPMCNHQVFKQTK